MEDYPNTILDFENRFASDAACRQYLFELRWAVVGENLLPLVNRVAALLKRWLEGTHQGAVRPSHFQYYLDEYTFRFNRRTSGSRGKLFYRLVQQAVAVDALRGRDIRGGRIHT